MAKKYELMRQQAALNYKQNGGNMKQAMIDAGYSESYANDHAKKVSGKVGKQIEEYQKEIKSDKIKSVAEIQAWWTEQMENLENDMKDRIKVSELLAKSQGAFIEKVELSGEVNNPFAGLSTEDLKKLVNDA